MASEQLTAVRCEDSLLKLEGSLGEESRGRHDGMIQNMQRCKRLKWMKAGGMRGFHARPVRDKYCGM